MNLSPSSRAAAVVLTIAALTLAAALHAAPRLIIDGVPFAPLDAQSPSFIDASGNLRVATQHGENPPSVTLTRSGSEPVSPGSSVQINWNISGASSCTPTNGTPEWRATPVSGTGNASFTLNASALFELVCSSALGQTYASVPVPVSAPAGPPTVSVTGPASVIVGGTVAINWSVSNVPNGSVCQFSSNPSSTAWNGQAVSTVSGSASSGLNLQLSSTGSNTFSLSCAVPGFAVQQASHTVSVSATPPATINSFTVNGVSGATSVASGGTVNLSAAFSNASGCTLSTTAPSTVQVTGSPLWTGNVTTSPVQRTLTLTNSSATSAGEVQFTLNCSPGNVIVSRQVTVAAPSSSLCADVTPPPFQDTSRTTLTSVFGSGANWGTGGAAALQQFFTPAQWVALAFTPTVANGFVSWSAGSDITGMFEVRISRCPGDFRSRDEGPQDERFCRLNGSTQFGSIQGVPVGGSWCPIRPGETHYMNIRLTSCPAASCQFYGNLQSGN